LVAAVGELTALPPVLTSMRNQLLACAEGRRVLRNRPCLHSRVVDMDKLRALPEGTLGREYVRLLDTEQVTPDSRAPIRYLKQKDSQRMNSSVDEVDARRLEKEDVTATRKMDEDQMPVVDTRVLSERAYVMLRYRQTHDFLHVVTGMPTTLVAELALKWFEFLQTGMSVV
jgi:ubiquinone biosynthesis protein COQ4